MVKINMSKTGGNSIDKLLFLLIFRHIG